MPDGDDMAWDVQLDDCTVVVELPRRLALDAVSSERLYEALSVLVTNSSVDRILTLVDVEHPLSERLYDVVQRAARRAAENGVQAWHVVAEHDRKGAALARAIPELETAVFADERAAQRRYA